MSLRWFVFLFAVGALVLLAESIPVEHPEGEVDEGVQLSPDSLDHGQPHIVEKREINLEDAVSDSLDHGQPHILEKRADKATTLEDALNIPIAALEAVKRLLSNRFGGSTQDQEAKNA